MKWQPIETAPIDGEFLVVGYAFAKKENGWWMAVAKGSKYGPYDESGEPLDYATHWMPLPEPPQ